MKIAYFDCFSGISGDMILGALVDAGVPFYRLKEGLSKLKLDGYTLTASTVLKKGIKATIVDVVGAVYGLQLLDAGRVVSSPIDTGSGCVEMSHGVFPIPAPATAELLKGIPVYSSGIERELTTPTGAAIITTMASSFQSLPEMRVSAIGYGAGGGEVEKKGKG